MESLARRIAARLAGMNFFTISEPEVSRVWPLDSSAEQERNKAIQAFAKERGWTANIHDPGIRVTFRKAKVESSGVLQSAASEDRPQAATAADSTRPPTTNYEIQKRASP
jgi:hypothetical protein